MSLLDKFQHWALEIIGTIILIALAYRFVMDITAGTQTFDIMWYVLGFAIALLMMGYKAIAKILLRQK